MIESKLSDDAKLSVRMFVDDLMHGPTTSELLQDFIEDVCELHNLSAEGDSDSNAHLFANVLDTKNRLYSSHSEYLEQEVLGLVNEYDRLTPAWSTLSLRRRS